MRWSHRLLTLVVTVVPACQAFFNVVHLMHGGSSTRTCTRVANLPYNNSPGKIKLQGEDHESGVWNDGIQADSRDRNLPEKLRNEAAQLQKQADKLRLEAQRDYYLLENEKLAWSREEIISGRALKKWQEEQAKAKQTKEHASQQPHKLEEDYIMQAVTTVAFRNSMARWIDLERLKAYLVQIEDLPLEGADYQKNLNFLIQQQIQILNDQMGTYFSLHELLLSEDFDELCQKSIGQGAYMAMTKAVKQENEDQAFGVWKGQLRFTSWHYPKIDGWVPQFHVFLYRIRWSNWYELY